MEGLWILFGNITFIFDHVVPELMEYCKKTASGVDPYPLMSGASQGDGSELLSGLLYS